MSVTPIRKIADRLACPYCDEIIPIPTLAEIVNRVPVQVIGNEICWRMVVHCNECHNLIQHRFSTTLMTRQTTRLQIDSDDTTQQPVVKIVETFTITRDRESASSAKLLTPDDRDGTVTAQ